MSRPKTSTLVTCGLLVLMCSLLIPHEALAADSGKTIGVNLGNLLGAWARSLFGGVVAIFSIGYLIGRRLNELAVFIGASVVVGGLIFASGTVANVIRSIWTTIGS